MKALCVVRNVWIPALIPWGASAFMPTLDSWPYYEFDTDAIGASQHDMPTHHITSRAPSMQHIPAYDYHSSSALHESPADAQWFGSGMPPSKFVMLASSLSSSGQLINPIRPMYYWESQHPSGQDSSGMTSRTPNSDQEFNNDSSEPKRKMTEASDASPPKKNKQTVAKMHDNHHQKPNTDTNNEVSISLAHRFSKSLLEEDDDRMGPFNSKLWQYAFLNTVNFPGIRYWKTNGGSYLNMLYNSDLWISLEGAGKASIRLPPLIEGFIHLGQDSERNHVAVKRARALLEDIFWRNSQLLLALTSPKSTPKPRTRRYLYQTDQITTLRPVEQGTLLAWLVELFNTRIDAQVFQAEPRHLNKNSDMRLSLKEMLFHYFTEDLETQEQNWGYWVKKANKDNRSPESKVTYRSAIKTKVVLNTLGTYYKKTNRTKWKMLFRQDYHFANFFGLLKHHEYHKSLHRLYKSHLNYSESLHLFPWENPAPTLDKSSRQICDRLSEAMGRFNLVSIGNYFEYVDNRIQGSSIPQNM